MQDLRLECGSYGFRAPKEVWENGTAYDIWKCFGPIWRGINDVQKVMIEGKEELMGGQLVRKVISLLSDLAPTLQHNSNLSLQKQSMI